MEEKQDGGVEGLEFTSSHKNTKTTTAEQPLTKKTRTYQKRYSTPKDKEEGKMRWQEGCFLDTMKSHTHWVGNPKYGK